MNFRHHSKRESHDSQCCEEAVTLLCMIWHLSGLFVHKALLLVYCRGGYIAEGLHLRMFVEFIYYYLHLLLVVVFILLVLALATTASASLLLYLLMYSLVV